VPELPDLEAYRVALETSAAGHRLREVTIHHPFLLRSVGTPPELAIGRKLVGIDRLGKRLVLAFDGGPYYVVHLMIAGRLRWKATDRGSGAGRASGRPAGRSGLLATMTFENGILTLAEAGTRRRASLHVVATAAEVAALDPGGSELLDGAMDARRFADLLRRENHTVKRSLTDPRLFAGIGNAYSDEILFAAKLSPFAMTGSLTDEATTRLFEAAVATLTEWRDRLSGEASRKFPTKVTAFRPEMRVHGKYGAPCVVCGTPVQRIRYAENECDYCPTCQAGGKVYADRALSRLLKGDCPRTVEELERIGRSAGPDAPPAPASPPGPGSPPDTPPGAP